MSGGMGEGRRDESGLKRNLVLVLTDRPRAVSREAAGTEALCFQLASPSLMMPWTAG